MDLKTKKFYAKELFCVLILTSINSKHTTNIPVFHFWVFFFLFFFWLCHMAYRILVPWPGTESGSTAVKAPSPNQWTTREFPPVLYSWTNINHLWERLKYQTDPFSKQHIQIWKSTCCALKTQLNVRPILHASYLRALFKRWLLSMWHWELKKHSTEETNWGMVYHHLVVSLVTVS